GRIGNGDRQACLAGSPYQPKVRSESLEECRFGNFPLLVRCFGAFLPGVESEGIVLGGFGSEAMLFELRLTQKDDRGTSRIRLANAVAEKSVDLRAIGKDRLADPEAAELFARFRSSAHIFEEPKETMARLILFGGRLVGGFERPREAGRAEIF